jgi:hypothetical protein
MRLMRRAAAGIGAAALGIGLLTVGTVPAWAAPPGQRVPRR